MNRRKQILGAIALPVILAIALYATFGSISICGDCGCLRNATDFQIPLTSITYWRWERVEQSPLSEVVQHSILGERHLHSWRLIHGGGHGITCALGSGGRIWRMARSPSVASFISDTCNYRGRAESRQWLSRALSDNECTAFDQWLLFKSYPEDGFENAAAYETWREEADSEWPEFRDNERLR